MSLIVELRRRNVHRTAAAYLAGSWLLLQIFETLLPVFGLADTVMRYAIIVLAIGFVPMLAGSWAFEWTPAGLQREQGAAAAKVTPANTTWDRIILALLAIALGMFAFDRFILSPQRDAVLIETATEAGAEMERAKVSAVANESVAVLPFTNMSADPNNEYFSDGLTETLLHMLTQLADLKVAARTSSFAFKNKNVDIRTIAATLSVAHVLEGSVQKAKNRIRVTAQLIRASDGFHVWSHNYDRDLDDVFAIQDEIAADVAKALGSSLLADNADAIVGVFTDDVSAYDIYLRALEKMAANTNESLPVAEEFLNEALARDPSFIDARLALLRTYFLQTWKYRKTEEILPYATALIDAILRVQPDHLAARQFDLWVRSVYASVEFDPAKELQLMEELLLLFDEGYGVPYLRRETAQFLAGAKRHDEALQLLRDGLIMDPLNVDLLWAQSSVLASAERQDEAMQPLMTALRVQPQNVLLYWKLGTLELNQNRVTAALDYFRQMTIIDQADPVPPFVIARTLAVLEIDTTSNYWLQVANSRSKEPGQRRLNTVLVASARRDEETLRRLVPDALDSILRGETDRQWGLIPLALQYTYIMHDDGKSRQAIDYFESYLPGISDVSSDAVADWDTFLLQTYVLTGPFRDLEDEVESRQRFETVLAGMRARSLPPEDQDYVYLSMEYRLKGLDAGRAAFLDRFADNPHLADTWQTLLQHPWYTEFLADPEVAAVFSAHEAALAEIRHEVQVMLQQPEWQQE